MERPRALAPKPSTGDLRGLSQSHLNAENDVPDGDASSRARIKTEEEWEAQRENFRQLYIVENLPLRKVMALMRIKHNFHAT